MTPSGTATPLVAGVSLLERAIGFTLGSLVLVRPEHLSRPTPCDRWDLQALLDHMNDSLLALSEAATGRTVSLEPDRTHEHPVAAVTSLRGRACRLLGDWTRAQPATGSGETDALVSVGGQSVSAALLAAAGAVEVAVHGWDVARACGRPRTIPAPLAAELLEPAPLLVRAGDRQYRFGPPRDAGADAGPGDRLVAFLGRQPGWGPG